MSISLALSELPDFAFPKERLGGFFGICPSWEYAEKAWYEYTLHEIPEKPLLIGGVFSCIDETLAPPNKHAMYLGIYPPPYDLREGNWDERKEETFDRAINILEEYAPNIKRAVISRYGLTPLDLERTFSMPRGDWAHGVMSWDQMLFFRPLVGYTNYRTPVANLYLCGSGVHPGGGVTASPGHNAAHVVLNDWKSGKIK